MRDKRDGSNRASLRQFCHQITKLHPLPDSQGNAGGTACFSRIEQDWNGISGRRVQWNYAVDLQDAIYQPRRRTRVENLGRPAGYLHGNRQWGFGEGVACGLAIETARVRPPETVGEDPYDSSPLRGV